MNGFGCKDDGHAACNRDSWLAIACGGRRSPPERSACRESRQLLRCSIACAGPPISLIYLATERRGGTHVDHPQPDHHPAPPAGAGRGAGACCRRAGTGPLPASSLPAFPTASTASSPAVSTSSPRLGAYLDPMADKLLLVWCSWSWASSGELPLWLVVTMVSRDALIVCAVLLSTVMAHPVEMKPLSGVEGQYRHPDRAGGGRAGRTRLCRATSTRSRPALILLSGVLTVASAAAYLVAWLRHMSGYGEGSTPGT